MAHQAACDSHDAPATAGASPCPSPQAIHRSSPESHPGRRREDVLRRLEALGCEELELLAARKRTPDGGPDVLESFIEWDLAVGA